MIGVGGHRCIEFVECISFEYLQTLIKIWITQLRYVCVTNPQKIHATWPQGLQLPSQTILVVFFLLFLSFLTRYWPVRCYGQQVFQFIHIPISIHSYSDNYHLRMYLPLSHTLISVAQQFLWTKIARRRSRQQIQNPTNISCPKPYYYELREFGIILTCKSSQIMQLFSHFPYKAKQLKVMQYNAGFFLLFSQTLLRQCHHLTRYCAYCRESPAISCTFIGQFYKQPQFFVSCKRHHRWSQQATIQDAQQSSLQVR